MHSKRMLLIAICCCLLASYACRASDRYQPEQVISSEDDSEVNDRIIYKSQTVKVELIDVPSETHPVFPEWAEPPGYSEIFSDKTVILTGVVKSVKPALVTREYMGSLVSSNITIFEMVVEGVFLHQPEGIENVDTVTIGVSGNKSFYYTGTPIVEEGMSFVVFCNYAADIHNTMEVYNYVDYWISYPYYLFLEKTGDSYIATDYFSDVSGALKVSALLNLTEQKISALSLLPDNEKTIKDYIENSIIPDAPPDSQEAAGALCVVKKRSVDSSEFEILLNHTFLINSYDFEDFVRSSVATQQHKKDLD